MTRKSWFDVLKRFEKYSFVLFLFVFDMYFLELYPTLWPVDRKMDNNVTLLMDDDNLLYVLDYARLD